MQVQSQGHTSRSWDSAAGICCCLVLLKYVVVTYPYHVLNPYISCFENSVDQLPLSSDQDLHCYTCNFSIHCIKTVSNEIQGFFQQFWEKASGQNWEKMIDFTPKFGEISGIEHNKGSKIYPQNQVILDCIMPTIPFKHKCLSIILIWVLVSHR